MLPLHFPYLFLRLWGSEQSVSKILPLNPMRAPCSFIQAKTTDKLSRCLIPRTPRSTSTVKPKRNSNNKNKLVFKLRQKESAQSTNLKRNSQIKVSIMTSCVVSKLVNKLSVLKLMSSKQRCPKST